MIIDILSIILLILAVVFALLNLLSFKFGIQYRKKIAEAEINSAEEKAKLIVADAAKDGEAKKRELLLEAKEENHKARLEFDNEVKERRSEISRQERRIQQKEENLDKKRSTVKIKKTVGTISYEESKSRSKDRSL